MLTSGSIHHPPTGSHRPSATRLRTSVIRLGSAAAAHSYNWAELAVNLKSGNSFMRSSAARKVLSPTDIDSGHGHNQGISMCAFPIMYSLYWGASGGHGVADCPNVFLTATENVQIIPTST